MKVLIISDAWYPQVNGVVRTYEFLKDELEAINHKVEVIGPADFDISLPMPFYPEIKLVISPYKKLKNMIEDYNPDKIHISTEGPLGWAGRRYCVENNIPYTTSFHTQFPDYIAKRFAWLIPPLHDYVRKKAIALARYFHAPAAKIFIATQSLEDQLKGWGFKNEMVLLTRGVNFSVFHTGHKNILTDIPSPVALYVGRVAIEKNLDAFLGMEWEGSKIIVGDGPIRKHLEKKYPAAIFVGKKTGHELADYYRSSDVFVFPSKTDTFGIVLIEALACGLPVAAYNVMGPKDIITEKHLGVLGDNLSECSTLASQLLDKSSRERHVIDNYSWKTAGKQFLSGL